MNTSFFFREALWEAEEHAQPEQEPACQAENCLYPNRDENSASKEYVSITI